MGFVVCLLRCPSPADMINEAGLEDPMIALFLPLVIVAIVLGIVVPS
jgi:hypothetical protein